MELEALLAALNAFPDKAKLIEGIKGQAKAIYQPIFNDGHGVAVAKSASEITELKQKVTTAEETATTAAEKLAQYTKEQPTVARLEEQYGEKLKELRAEIKAEREGRKADKLTTAKSLAIGKLRSKLGAIIEDDMAESIADRQAIQDRIQVTDTGTRVLQKGQQIPFAGSEDEQIAALVEELKESVKPIFLKATASKGSGTEATEGGAGAPAKGAALYAKIRKDATDKHKPATTGRDALLERTGQAAR